MLFFGCFHFPLGVHLKAVLVILSSSFDKMFDCGSNDLCRDLPMAAISVFPSSGRHLPSCQQDPSPGKLKQDHKISVGNNFSKHYLQRDGRHGNSTFNEVVPWKHYL